ncbi:MAG: hypothetical protein SchgKO_06280 [Schleiferiaceae bacterium]
MFFFAGHFSNAQSYRFGISGGGGASFLNGDHILTGFNKHTFSYSAGLHGIASFGDIEVKLQLFYEAKGDGYEFIVSPPDQPEFDSDKAQSVRRYSYITIPLVVSYRFGSSKNFGVGLGPYAAFLNEHKITTTIGSQEYVFGSAEDWNSFDMGLSLAVDYRYGLTKNWFLTAEATGNLGLIDMYKENSLDYNMYNQNYLLSLGVQYAL